MTKKAYGKILVLLMAAIIWKGILVGCSDRSVVRLDPNNPVTIVIWHYYHGAQKGAFDQAVNDFNETEGFQKGIIVEAVSYGGVTELADNVLAAAKGELDAGNMPDLFGSHGDTALMFLDMQKAASFDPYITADELAEYEESFVKEGRIGTKSLYVFPIAKSTESLMLNKTDFDIFVDSLHASGSNEAVSYEDLLTWEGIARVADVYYRYTQSVSPVHEGKAFFGIESLANYFIIGAKQLGQDIVKVENGAAVIGIDKESMKKLWDFYYKEMVTGRFTKLGRFCSDDIKTGDSLCYIGSTTSANYFPTELVGDGGESKDIEMMVLPMPVFKNGDKVAISQGAGMVMVQSSKEKEYAAAVFVKWFTEVDRNVSFSINSSYLPVKKSALGEALLAEAFTAIDTNDENAMNSVKALKVGVEQLSEYTMYTSEVFDGSADFRDRLPRALANAVQVDRAAYVELIRESFSEEEAYTQLYENNLIVFEEWFGSLGTKKVQ